MNTCKPTSDPKNNNSHPIILFLLVGCGLALLIALWPRHKSATDEPTSADAKSGFDATERPNRPSFARRAGTGAKESQAAEEKVAARLIAFTKNRREVMHRYAERLGVPVPADLEKFFDVAETGNWDEIDRLYKELQKRKTDRNDPESMDLHKLMHTAQETWGAQQCAQTWPAQALLDYGRDTLGALKPGMVYIGGTDPGRFIPTFLNDTSGNQHVVLTQNAMADATYLDYVNFLYGDRLQTLSREDSQSAFNQYLEDVGKRFAHDRDFPDEPKQMLPDEKYESIDGRVSVSGIVAVMGVNEFLVKILQQKNPELSFAMEESFSLPSTYEGALPLGPLLQLGSTTTPEPLTPEIAASSIDYWRDRVNQFTSAQQFDPTRDAERTYAHMIVAQGNLFQSQNFSAEAEQAYRLAQQLASRDVEPVSKLYDLLMGTGRANEAAIILSQFQQAHPDKIEELRKFRRTRR